MASPAGEHSVRVAPYSSRIAYKEWGSSEGRAVLAVHGFLDSAGAWDIMAPHLCAALRCRVLAMDLPGHGLSEHTGRYTSPDMAAAVVGFVRALALPTPLLAIGHSYGAEVLCLLAGTAPGLIKRFVCFDNAALPPPIAVGAMMGPFGARLSMREAVGRHLRRTVLQPHEPRPAGSLEAVIAARVERSQTSIFPLDHTAARNIHSRNYRPVGDDDASVAVAPRWDPCLVTSQMLFQCRDELEGILEVQRAIEASVLVVRFDTWRSEEYADSLFGRRAAIEATLAAIRNVEVADVEGPHHAFAMAGPASEQCARLAASFLGAAHVPKSCL